MRNLARLLAITTQEQYKSIRIRGGILTVTNGAMMIRRYCPDTPDGDYTVDGDGKLARIGTIHWYPEVEKMEAHVNGSPRLCEVEPRIRGHLANLCHQANQVKRPVTMDATGAWIDDEADERIDGITFPFNLPHPVRFPANQMVIALNELARYDNVKFLKTSDPKSPMVMGLNWAECVLIMPLAHHYDRMQDDMQRQATA